MTREEFYELTDILNSEVLGNFMHGGEADELLAMFEEAVDHSNILEQEKPVNIWHDANQQPEINTPILVRTYDNIVVSTKRYDDNLIPWEDRIKRDEITHWCYVEDLLKL